MPFLYEAVRDYITINSTTIRAVFIFTESDLTQTADSALLAAEQPTIPRQTVAYRYTSNPVEFIKTLVVEPVVVESSDVGKFNTILLVANGVVLARYQLGTTVNLTPGNPAIITLGSINFDFNGRLLDNDG